jgi:hypothetical protein
MVRHDGKVNVTLTIPSCWYTGRCNTVYEIATPAQDSDSTTIACGKPEVSNCRITHPLKVRPCIPTYCQISNRHWQIQLVSWTMLSPFIGIYPAAHSPSLNWSRPVQRRHTSRLAVLTPVSYYNLKPLACSMLQTTFKSHHRKGKISLLPYSTSKDSRFASQLRMTCSEI